MILLFVDTHCILAISHAIMLLSMDTILVHCLCENLMIIYVAYTAHVIAYSISAASFWWCCNTVRWAWLAWGLSGWLTTLLQCFDTVGWVIRPVKTVGRITYIVLVQTLNHA